MQNLRAALEKLDDAIDQLDELAVATRTVAPATSVMPIITPRAPESINRAELIRRLDETIQDVQQMMEQAA